ncbi:hypothetical protein SKAU_G00007800 [Synaphobranchus kaupii]|uniref:Uncharacterized protein n=1 Tax=Synaphobranchus kaupii TaxID=118154 RepID=A0A9Q1G9K7_SYNKA|nr:hypothetical protein SKAU_G00007800 [Synaphobranchus kaupii]
MQEWSCAEHTEERKERRYSRPSRPWKIRMKRTSRRRMQEQTIRRRKKNLAGLKEEEARADPSQPSSTISLEFLRQYSRRRCMFKGQRRGPRHKIGDKGTKGELDSNQGIKGKGIRTGDKVREVMCRISRDPLRVRQYAGVWTNRAYKKILP